MILRPKYRLLFLLCLVFSSAMAGEKQDITLELKPVFRGAALAIGTGTYTTIQGDTVSIERLRFYLSAVVLTFENGEKYTETNSYHLIDAENPASYLVTLKNAPAGKVVSVDFNIGVDSIASVSGAMGGDLDPMKGMYWAWNSGYINAKLEGTCKTNRSKKNYLFEFHIGGYMQPYCALRHVTLPLQETTGANIILKADVSAWLEGVNLKRENSVVIPGKEAMEAADKYSNMFSLKL